MINETDERMLRLLADVLHGHTPDKIPEGEWPGLFKELHDQTVHFLPAEYIYALGLPAKDEGSYLKVVLRNRQLFHRLMKEQKRVFDLLDAEGIPAVVLKGAAAAVNYARPENRCMGDIDILVLPQDFGRARDILLGAGCHPLEGPDDPRHTGMLTESGAKIELHRYFSSSDNDEQNAALDEMLYQAVPSRVSAKLCGYPLYMLPPKENGLVLLGHINQHLSVGLGLRQIIDWMEYVEKHLDDEAWDNGFAEAAERIGMKRLAMLTTAMCRKYLGLKKDIHWCSYEPACDELMEYILSRGNFGSKLNRSFTEIKTITVLSNFRNPLQGLRHAQKRGLINWKACQRHPWLRPFAWCYQLVRWPVKGIREGVSSGMLSKASDSAKEESGLMKSFGVTKL